MSYLNTKSNRVFDFMAPYTEEGEKVQRIVFPIAVTRKPEDSTHIKHDCNPQIMDFASGSSAGTFQVDTQVQAGSLMVVINRAASNVQTIGGVACAANKVSTLMWNGLAYFKLGESAIPE